MKKIFLLTILPALMVLSACAGTQPKKEAVQVEPEFVEDTLAHEELFGEVSQQMRLTPYKGLAEPSDPSLRKPEIGVQYKDDGDGKFAIRYVAAIAALDVEATWTRSICNKYGSQQQHAGDDKFVTKACTYAYTAVSADNDNGDTYTTPETVNENFHYFVVYTLRNVPADQLNSYLFAYLTLTKGVESVRSFARISQISGGNSFTYDTENASHEFFAQGRINGSNGEILPLDDALTDSNLGQKSGITLAANDNFGIFKVASDHFQCFGYDQFRQCIPFTTRVASNNYCKIATGGSHSIFVNGSNEVHVVVPDAVKETTKLYLNPNSDWKSAGARFAVYAFHKTGETTDREAWYDLKPDGSYYSVTFNTAQYPQFIFCRMNGANATNEWANKWNQTNDLSLNCNMYNITGWDNSGNWSIYE